MKRLRLVKNRSKRSSPCMYPMAKKWIRDPTPVTTRTISAASGSQSSSRLAPMAGIHSHNNTVVECSPPWMSGHAATRAKTNAEVLAREASQPLSGSPTKRPRKWSSTAPANGRAMINQRKSVTRRDPSIHDPRSTRTRPTGVCSARGVRGETRRPSEQRGLPRAEVGRQSRESAE